MSLLWLRKDWALADGGRKGCQGCHLKAKACQIGQEVNNRGGRGLKDHLIQIPQSGGPQAEFDSQIIGLLTVFKIKVWISDSLESEILWKYQKI